MLDPKRISDFEQAETMLVETLPPLWWKMFVKLKGEGFNEIQAMELLKEFIKASHSNS